jgi:hypothetical protein
MMLGALFLIDLNFYEATTDMKGAGTSNSAVV